MIDYTKARRPAPITTQEINDKLAHMKGVLEAGGKSGILITQEGGIRWLTGVRHQIIDQTPDSASPVQACCKFNGNTWMLTFISAPFEMPRIKDELSKVFKGVKGVRIKFAGERPKETKGIALPGQSTYAAISGRIFRPLIGGLKGNQYKKYAWVGGMMNALAVKTAYELVPGMNGREVRALMFKNFADAGVESNMFLIALKGQEHHLHPLYAGRYKVPAMGWVKLVSAGRLADVIVSETLMVKFGKLTAKETAVHQALQEAAVEYADLYRNGINEQDLYAGCGKRFKQIERKYGLKGFGKCAYLHHLGGPTSPLGNRDYCLDKNSKADCFAGMSFAINPVESLCCTKVELQGIVSESGAPHMLDFSLYTDPKLASFREITSQGGTVCQVSNPVIR